MTKHDQDISEPIYQDIKAIADKYINFGKSEFANKDELMHQMTVEIVDACEKNNYFSVRYY